MTRSWSGCAEWTYTCVAPAANSSSMRRMWTAEARPIAPERTRGPGRGGAGGGGPPAGRVRLRYQLAHHRAELPERRRCQRLVLVPDDRVELGQDGHLAGALARRRGGRAGRLPHLRPLGPRGGGRYSSLPQPTPEH